MEKIIELIRINPHFTIEELSNNIGRTTRTIEMELQKLKVKNKIKRVGPDRGGYWKVN